MDTSSVEETIDALVFEKFQLILYVGKKELLTMVMLSKLYNGLDFGITYLYMTESTKNEIASMLLQSTFEK